MCSKNELSSKTFEELQDLYLNMFNQYPLINFIGVGQKAKDRIINALITHSEIDYVEQHDPTEGLDL